MRCPGHDIVVELAFALANGEALSPELAGVRAHGRDCEACRDLLRSTIHALTAAKGVLCPADAGQGPSPRGEECLDDNLLAEYLDDTLSQEARDAAESHLARCIHCLRELAELSEVAAVAEEEAPSEEAGMVHDAARTEVVPSGDAFRYVLRVVQGGLEWLEQPHSGFALLPAAGGLLGPDSAATATQRSWTWIQESGDRRLRFHVTQVVDDSVNMAIALDGEPTQEGARLQLNSQGRIVQSEVFSNSGNVFVSGLALGEYSGEVAYPAGGSVHFQVAFQKKD